MTTISAQIITSGVVTNSILVDSSAVLSNGGETLSGAGFSLTAPSGSTFILQAGAGIGWTLSGGVLVAPASPAPAAPSQAQLLGAANFKVASLMAVPRTYALGGSVSVKCDGMQGTGADLAGLNAWGSANPTATTTWVDDFGVPTTITGAQGVTLALSVVAYGQSVYNMLGASATEIASGSITTVAQVNALAWPT
jgi:hypothetical protein